MTQHGKVVYLEIPCADRQGAVEEAVAFYTRLFGWGTRERGDGEIAFDDATGGVSGAWRPGRPPQDQPGVLVYVNVDDVHATLALVEPAGGTIVQPVGGDPGELTARVRDPYGNLIGIYQEPVA